MRLILILSVLIFSLTEVFSIDSYNYLFESRSPDRLSFVEGDIIACVINSNVFSELYRADHVMLAINSRKVVHIFDVDVTESVGYLRESDFEDVVKEKKYGSCRIATTQYDRIMYDLGIVPRKGSFGHYFRSSQRAGARTYYDVNGCNCQHWVTYWKYGTAWSPQSNQAPSSSCRMSNSIASPPSGSSGAYAKPFQAGARADATVGTGTFSGSVFNGKATGPSAGAYAEAGVQSTGAGFKASLGEVRVGAGKAVGVTLGASADTGIHAGGDGLGLQVLGTGWEYSKSKGTKFCIFGSCLHFGG